MKFQENTEMPDLYVYVQVNLGVSFELFIGNLLERWSSKTLYVKKEIQISSAGSDKLIFR